MRRSDILRVLTDTGIGNILTRVVCKGSYALGVLWEHQRELEVLTMLLEQKRWRRARRGRWYERAALVLMHHLKDEDDSLERAMEVVVAALKDPDTHIGEQLMDQTGCASYTTC